MPSATRSYDPWEKAFLGADLGWLTALTPLLHTSLGDLAVPFPPFPCSRRCSRPTLEAKNEPLRAWIALQELEGGEHADEGGPLLELDLNGAMQGHWCEKELWGTA